MNATKTLFAAQLEPWQLNHYKALAQPLTIGEAARQVDAIAADLSALHAAGDREAARGATELLRVAILELVAVDAPSVRALEKKVARLTRHTHLLEPGCDGLIGTALRLDFMRLGLSSADEVRIRAMLPKITGPH